MDSATPFSLRPALLIHDQTAPRFTSPHPQTRPIRVPQPRQNAHCDDTQCFIYTPISQADRWAEFDAFDPREVDDYSAFPYPTLSSSPVFASIDARRVKRAEELRSRAKARLMPPYDPAVSSRRVRRGPVDHTCPATPPRRHAFRTPSPAPESGPRYCESVTATIKVKVPTTPKTPIRGRRLWESTCTPSTPTHTATPASTVAARSPMPTPCPAARFQSPSP